MKDTLLAVSKNIIKIDNFRDTLTLSIGNDTAIVNIKRMEGIRKTSNQLIQASYSKLDALYLLKSVSKVDDNDNMTSLIETLPSIVATSAFFVPTVSLLGSFTKKDNAFSANVQIFRGTANADTTQFDNLRKLIEPNASNFGINLSIFKAFDIKDDDSKRFLGAYLKNYFLFKDLPNQKTIQTKSKEGSKVINTAFIQINGGIEFAPVPKIRDVFTVYSGGNLIWNLNQYDNFKSYFQNNTKKVQYYFNTGFRFSIPLAVDAGKISNSLLVVDINCLFVNQSLRQLHNISDSVIPVMSLGIKKSIAKL